MRNYITTLIAILFIASTSFAQINGNGKLITKNYDLKSIKLLEVDLHANIIVDMAKEPGIQITAESNIIEYIGRNYRKGCLSLDQVEWIEPTIPVNIIIGAPDFYELEQDAHDKTSVINIDKERIKIEANIGEVELTGRVGKLIIETKKASINASDLIATDAEVTTTGYAELKLNVISFLDCDFDEDTAVKLVNEPLKTAGCNSSNDLKDDPYFKNARFINFKIKNNSASRNNFEVVGPKKDGRTFGYGFPMWPGQTKDKYWSVGTKIYKTSWTGGRKLVRTITAEDEGKVVKIFGE